MENKTYIIYCDESVSKGPYYSNFYGVALVDSENFEWITEMLNQKKQELNGFYLLYYQFIKHAFGLEYCNPEDGKVYLRTYFDKLPNTREQNELFKQYIYNLQTLEEFTGANIHIRREDITDVDSKKHVILQGTDIILGAIQFKLNKENEVKNPETGRRGKRTIAKDKLYREISRNIRKIHPNFNIGISTGFADDKTKLWWQTYRHWSFIPDSYIGERKEF